MKIHRKVSTTLKIGVSLIFLTLVLSQLNWQEILKLLSDSKPFYFLFSILFFIASQWLSVYRLNSCFNCINLSISNLANAQLYLLGMFYNFFIPGGIGGDAYKIYILNKTFKTPIKQLTVALFVDRLFGLFGIGVCLALFLFFIPNDWISNKAKILVISGALIIGLLTAILIIKTMFKAYKRIAFTGILYSIGIQLLQVLSVYFILKAISIHDHYFSYFVLFLVSSITSIISFAGIGTREAVFFYGAKYLQFNPNVSTTIGLCFSLVTLVVSLLGVYFLFQPINFQEKNR